MGLGLRGSGAGRTWGLILALFLAVVVYWLPLEGLTPAGHKALALFAGIFVLYLSQALPLAITSLAVVPLAVLWGIAPLRTALRPFASPIIFLLLGAFLLSAAMLETGLANRLTFLILKKSGDHYLSDYLRGYAGKHRAELPDPLQHRQSSHLAAALPQHHQPF